jgi:hypothetical protein
MSHRAGAWFAWSVWALTVPTTILTLIFASLNEPSPSLWDEVLLPVLILTFATVGALVASYRPENAIGWLFLTGAFVWIVGELTLEYGVYSLITDPGALPAGVWTAWFGARDRVVRNRYVLTLAVSYGEAALSRLASGLVGDCGLRRAFHDGVLAISGDQRPAAGSRS